MAHCPIPDIKSVPQDTSSTLTGFAFYCLVAYTYGVDRLKIRHMKAKKKQSKNKKYLALAAILVVLLAGYSLAAHHQSWWPFHVESHADKNAARNDTVANPSPKNSSIPDKTGLSSSTDASKNSDQIPVDTSMTASIAQLSETDGQVNFTGKVTNTDSAGTCVVTFSNPNDRPVTKQFTATYANGTSQCGPMHVSAYEFSYLGQWQVSFRYYTGDKQATAESTIAIK